MTPKPTENAKLVIDGFLESLLNNRQFHRKDEFMHPDFVKHFHDGKPDCDGDEFLKQYQGMLTQFPQLKSRVKKSIADDECVWVWTEIEGLPEGFGLDIVEICRVKDGRIVEKWDVHQQKASG